MAIYENWGGWLGWDLKQLERTGCCLVGGLVGWGIPIVGSNYIGGHLGWVMY